MKPETMRGYLYVPQGEAPPMLVYARVLTGVALGIVVEGDTARMPERARAVTQAVHGKPVGLYHARVALDTAAPALATTGRVRFKVSCGRRVKAGPAEEVAVLTARVKTRRQPGKRQDPKRLRSAREARALVDALRTHVLPLTRRAAPAVAP